MRLAFLFVASIAATVSDVHNPRAQGFATVKPGADISLADPPNAVETTTVEMSVRMHRAIQASLKYREEVQRAALRAQERVVDNFSILIDPANPDLSPTDQKRYFVVGLRPLFAPGERVVTDGGERRFGRMAFYLVTKEEQRVMRVRFQDEKWRDVSEK